MQYRKEPSMPSRLNLTDEIIQMRNAAYPVAKIAATLGCSIPYVYKVSKGQAFPPPARMPRASRVQAASARMHMRGHPKKPLDKVAAEYGVSRSTLNRLGITRADRDDAKLLDVFRRRLRGETYHQICYATQLGDPSRVTRLLRGRWKEAWEQYQSDQTVIRLYCRNLDQPEISEETGYSEAMVNSAIRFYNWQRRLLAGKREQIEHERYAQYIKDHRRKSNG
jgi:predicted DNA-binding transcriptional regulator AlpA